MKIVYKTFSIIVVMLGTLGISPVTVEGQDRSVPRSSNSLYSVIDEDGWPIPHSPADKKMPKTDRTIQGVSVSEIRYKLGLEPESKLVLYSLRDDGVLVQRRLHVALRALAALEFGGRTFAYHCTYLQVGISDSVGKAYFGPPIDIYYVDANADGSFETRIYSPRGDLDKLPDWLRPGK